MAIEVPSRVQLSDEELDALIDAEARKRLGIPGQEFKRRYGNKDRSLLLRCDEEGRLLSL